MKQKSTALILCIFLGGLGIHMFYLDRNFSALMRLLFFWTFIPTIIAFFEIFQFAFMTEDSFNQTYNSNVHMDTVSPAEQLTKLGALYEKKFLTTEEFEAKKLILLKKIG